MSDDGDVRLLNPLPSGAPEGEPTLRGDFFIPKRLEDRGTLQFACPTCGHVLLREMSDRFAKIAQPVHCYSCDQWLTPRDLSPQD